MTLITHFKITFFTNLPENAPVRIQRTVKNISIPVRIKVSSGINHFKKYRNISLNFHSFYII
jgi:hypothetical protein